MALGAAMWRATIKQQPTGGALAPGNFAVLVGLLVGAALGNKGVFLIERPDVALAMWQGQPVWPGQSIVGGLLGGLIGVETAKALTARPAAPATPWCGPSPWGWPSVVSAASSPACMTTPTACPPQHPGAWTSATAHRAPDPALRDCRRAAAGLGAAPRALRHARRRVQGLLSSYLAWRFLVEFLKPVPVAGPLGFSCIQWTCLVALAAYLPLTLRPPAPPHEPQSPPLPVLRYDAVGLHHLPAPVEAKILIKDGQVFMDKWCPAMAPSACSSATTPTTTACAARCS